MASGSTIVETQSSGSRDRTRASHGTLPHSHRDRWLFTPAVDVAVFLGSAVVSFVLLAVGAAYGMLHETTPEWTWVTTVLLVDVAHVYATGFRVYFDPVEIRRRPLLYWGTPVVCFLAGITVYDGLGHAVFWRVLAYVAVFHFVRQQYGWVALYRAKCGERGAVGRWIDTLAIYLATIYPLVYWHAHLPRGFEWFVATDFQPIPGIVERIAWPVYCLSLVAYGVRSVVLWRTGRGNPGKDIVLVTTAACWYVGIVTFDSDYAFTVTNVVIHGVPYVALVYYHGQRTAERRGGANARWTTRLVTIVATIWFLAYVEELVWDRAVWMERGWLFGPAWNGGDWTPILVPLLATPQLTHYVLDGFIWRRRTNPDVQDTVTRQT